MPYIKVDIDKIRQYQQEVYKIRRRLNTISDSFYSTAYQLDLDIKNSGGIGRKLQSILDALVNEGDSLRKMNTFLSNTAIRYTNVEQALLANERPSTGGGYTSVDEVINAIAARSELDRYVVENMVVSGDFTVSDLTSYALGGVAVGQLHDTIQQFTTPPLTDAQDVYDGGGEGDGGGRDDDGLQKKDAGWGAGSKGDHSLGFKDDLEDWLEEKNLRDEREEETYHTPKTKEELEKDRNDKDDKNDGRFKDVDPKDAPTFYDRSHTIAEVTYGGELLYGTLWGIGNRVDTDDDGTYGYLAIGEGELHGELAAGFYVYTADGKKVFSPGVHADIGGSISLLHTEGELQLLGDENFGLDIGGEVKIGSIGAGAEADVQFMDENGKFNPQISVKGEAEAIVAEAEARASVDILGGGVEAAIGVNFGVGAHAEVGWKDGVFKLDVGASLGIGFSLDVEIDFGSMVETVVDAAECVGDWISDTAEDVGEWISNAAEDVGNFFEDVGENVGNFFEDVGNWFASW